MTTIEFRALSVVLEKLAGAVGREVDGSGSERERQ
jgi:hypothetical protein